MGGASVGFARSASGEPARIMAAIISKAPRGRTELLTSLLLALTIERRPRSGGKLWRKFLMDAVDAPDSFVIGVDYGTLSGRAVVVRVRDGKELGSGVYD